VICKRDAAGRLIPLDPLARFASKCAFDPATGCVMWIGTTTHGKGRNEPYGYFWFDGRMWLAHRWAARHIHGLEIDELEVDHCCPCGPSTLCVQHLAGETGDVNRALRLERESRPATQTLQTKRYWLFVSLGIEPYRPPLREVSNVPFFDPPAWLTPFLSKQENTNDRHPDPRRIPGAASALRGSDCPF
jgi:hypothetical protein